MITALDPRLLNSGEIAQVVEVFKKGMKGSVALPWYPHQVMADFFGEKKKVYLGMYVDGALVALVILTVASELLQLQNQWSHHSAPKTWLSVMMETICEVGKAANCRHLDFWSCHSERALERFLGGTGFEKIDTLHVFRKEIE